jgi:hypothetical protein
MIHQRQEDGPVLSFLDDQDIRLCQDVVDCQGAFLQAALILGCRDNTVVGKRVVEAIEKVRQVEDSQREALLQWLYTILLR